MRSGKIGLFGLDRVFGLARVFGLDSVPGLSRGALGDVWRRVCALVSSGVFGLDRAIQTRWVLD